MSNAEKCLKSDLPKEKSNVAGWNIGFGFRPSDFTWPSPRCTRFSNHSNLPSPQNRLFPKPAVVARVPSRAVTAVSGAAACSSGVARKECWSVERSAMFR